MAESGGAFDFPVAAFPDRSLFLVNYRGYGGSSGRPAEAALFADALSIFDHARAENSEIAVMGRSLGSSVAVFALGQAQVVDVPRVGHNTLDESLEYLGSVGRFLRRSEEIRER